VNKKILKYVFYIIAMHTLVTSCAFLNRTETDVHTISDKDTTAFRINQIKPTNSIYPTDKEFQKNNDLLQRDSIVKRHYPDFIRAGLFESYGGFSSLSGKGEQKYFGMLNQYKNKRLFGFGHTRLGFLEKELLWDDDIKGFSYGVTFFEKYYLNQERSIDGIFTLMLKKQHSLFDDYEMLRLSTVLEFSFVYDEYLNIFEVLEIGSMGGLNLKAKAGCLYSTKNEKGFHPYFALGFSIFDFANYPYENNIEWKDMKHKGRIISALTISTTLSGVEFDILETKIPINYIDKRLLFGINTVSTKYEDGETTYSVLPISLSFMQNLYKEKFVLMPFYQIAVMPTTMHNLGVETLFRVSEMVNLRAGIKYSYGEEYYPYETDIEYTIKDIDAIKFYLKIGLGSRMFFSNEMVD
jgi:hypothetical protein